METPIRYTQQPTKRNTKYLWPFVILGAVVGAIAALAMETNGFAHLQEFFTGVAAGRWNEDMAGLLSIVLGGIAFGVSAMVIAWLVWTKSKDRAVQ